MSKKMKTNLVAYSMVLPAFLVVMLTVAYPIVTAIIQSFQDGETGSFTLVNYTYFFTDKAQRNNLLYTLYIVVVTVVIAIVVAYLLALYLRFVKSRISKTIGMLYLLPRFVPSMCAVYAMITIIRDSGLVNRIGQLFGVDINLGMIARLKEQAGIHSGLVARVLDAVAATIQVDEDDLEIYTSGATNFFKYPELSDKTKATELISAFEEKQQLADFVKERMADTDNTGVQVYIGDELPIDTMKDCSVVTATYELGEGMHGTIGIVGPKRMDYENVVDNLKTLKDELDQVFGRKKKKEDSQ